MKRAFALAALCVAIALVVGSCSAPTVVEERPPDTELEAWRAWQRGAKEGKAPKAPVAPKAAPKKAGPRPPVEPPKKAPAKPPPKAAPKAKPPTPPKAPPKKAAPKPPPRPKPPAKAAPKPKKPEPPKKATPKAKPPVPPKPPVEPPKKAAPKPPVPPKKTPGPKPKAAAAPKAPSKPPEKPKEEKPEEAEPPPPPPPPPPVLFVFLPQQRAAYVAGERAEVTVVVTNEGPLQRADVALVLTDEAGTTWRVADRLGALEPGRRSVTYGIDAARFPPGTYNLAAHLGDQSSKSVKLIFTSSARATNFPIIGWPEKRPRHALDARRWSQVLGLNTVFLQRRTPWRTAPAHRLDASAAKAFERLRAEPGAKPLELGKGAPPFIRAADLLTGAGLRWINACAVSGGGQALLAPKYSFADPLVVRGGRQRIHHKLLAERGFQNCLGIHFTTETALPPHAAGGQESPFGSPMRLAQFQRRTGLKKVPWRDGVKKWDVWQRFLTYRAGILGEALANWTDAVRAIEPGYVATSQLYEPINLAAGVYPPLQGKALPILTAQVALDGPAGMAMSAIAADLQRAGNWGKPLWFMPQVDAEADLDAVRASLHLAIARKADGVVYPPGLDYHFDRPEAGPLAPELMAGISGINQQLTELGDFLLALKKVREPVAIFYSVTEHMARIGRDPVKEPDALDYPWTLLTAYQACMLAHFPATFLTEEELLAGEAAQSQLLLVIGVTRIRDDVKSKLEAYIAEGGVVLTDPTTTVSIEGAKATKIEFPSFTKHLEAIKPTVKTADALAFERRDALVQRELLFPILGLLRAEFKKYIQRDYTVSIPSVLVSEQRAGDARYYFVVNAAQTFDLYRGLNYELRPAAVRLILRKARVLYDTIGGKHIQVPRLKGRPVVPLVLPAGGMKIIADLPDVIGGVYIRRARLSGDGLEVSAYVIAGKQERPRWGEEFLRALCYACLPRGRPKAIRAAVPIEITVLDPDGVERLRLYRVYPGTDYRETIPFPDYQKPGKWKVVVRERLSGTSAEAAFRVRGRARRWAWRQGELAVFDGDRIQSVLRSGQPLWIVVGTEAEVEAAERLAAALGTEERQVEIKMARDLVKPRKLDANVAARTISPAPSNDAMPDVRQAAILLGNIATHPLLQAVHNYGLLPRQVTPDYPGPGRALLCWLTSVFEPDAEVVVATAADAAGVQRAVEALLRAARGRAPLTAWRRVTTSVALAEAKPRSQEEAVAVLKPAWTRSRLDNPTSATAALAGDFFVLGSHDGRVVSYDTTGAIDWQFQCSTRVRNVAVSPDGAWSAAASFPEVVVITAHGQAHWGKLLQERGLRADFTAVAIGPNAALTLVGTRSGGVLAVDDGGKRVFSLGVEIEDRQPGTAVPGVGEPAPKEKPTAEAKRLGAVNAIAIAASLEFAVIGTERETVILGLKGEDPGKELWASSKFQHIAAVALNDEKGLVALGSRDGYVACIEKDGTPRWRVPAEGYVLSVCFRGASESVIAASLDGTLTCYDGKGKVLWQHRSPTGFRFVASSAFGDVIAAAELSGKVILVNAVGDIVAETTPLRGVVRAMAFSAGGNRLLIGTSANEVSFFKRERPKIEEDDL